MLLLVQPLAREESLGDILLLRMNRPDFSSQSGASVKARQVRSEN